MIAAQRIEPEPPPNRRRREQQAELTRAATRRRFARAQRRGYEAFVRVTGAGAIVVLPLLLYVMLTANLTGLNYALARTQAQKSTLLAQTMRQEDRIAKLESRERLAALAARLHMHDPGDYAVVTLPSSEHRPAQERGFPAFGAVGHWLGTVVSGSPR